MNLECGQECNPCVSMMPCSQRLRCRASSPLRSEAAHRPPDPQLGAGGIDPEAPLLIKPTGTHGCLIGSSVFACTRTREADPDWNRQCGGQNREVGAPLGRIRRQLQFLRLVSQGVV